MSVGDGVGAFVGNEVGCVWCGNKYIWKWVYWVILLEEIANNKSEEKYMSSSHCVHWWLSWIFGWKWGRLRLMLKSNIYEMNTWRYYVAIEVDWNGTLWYNIAIDCKHDTSRAWSSTHPACWWLGWTLIRLLSCNNGRLGGWCGWLQICNDRRLCGAWSGLARWLWQWKWSIPKLRYWDIILQLYWNKLRTIQEKQTVWSYSHPVRWRLSWNLGWKWSCWLHLLLESNIHGN